MISIKENKLTIEIPLKVEQYDPWTDESVGIRDNICGLITKEDEMGFCYLIDMSYKGKGDQYSEYFYKYFGLREDFENLCNELGIDCFVNIVTRCTECDEIICNDLSDLCYECLKDY